MTNTAGNRIKKFINNITGQVELTRQASRGYQSLHDDTDKNATINESMIEESYVMNNDVGFSQQLDMQPFAHPNDINWRNITFEKKFIGLKRFVLTLIAVLILIFVTTPTALVELVTGNSDRFRKATYMTWVQGSSDFVKVIFKATFPALIVIWVNQILLFIIYILVNLESHHRYSTYQLSMLNKTFLYFLMNMIVMPGFAAVTLSNIYEVLSKGLTSKKSIFAQIFLFEKGDFFVTLIIQTAAATVFWGLSSMSDLIWSYLSPTLLIKFRSLTSSKPNWMKFDYDIYHYGNNYAQHTVVLGIAIVFQ